MTLSEAKKLISTHNQELKKLGVKSILIFGSVARNQARPSSDIDLLVEFSKPVSLFEFLEIKEFLERILKVRVDLVTEPALKAPLKEKILKEAIRAA